MSSPQVRLLGWKYAGRAFVYSLLLGTLAFLAHRYWYVVTVPVPTQEDDIREAVLRQGLGEQYSGCGPGGEACCMSLEDRGDPSDAFLARFQGQFRKGSECELEKPGPYFRHIKTGKPAARIKVSSVQWLGPTEARLEVGLVCGSLCGVGGTFAIHWTSDGWTVESLERWVA